MERISIRYDAPVFVTVNVDTGDVERVYMDDTAVERNAQEPLYCLDTTPEYALSPLHHREHAEIRARAIDIADGVDWTSTDGRCQVWRGAYGGPGNITDIFRRALLFVESALDRGQGQLIGITTSECKAALLFLHDSEAWEKEHTLG